MFRHFICFKTDLWQVQTQNVYVRLEQPKINNDLTSPNELNRLSDDGPKTIVYEINKTHQALHFTYA